MKKIILLSALILSFVACNDTEQKENHQSNMLPSTPYTQVEKVLSNKQATFLEFGSTECKSCIEMDKLLYKVKTKHPKSNLFFIDIYKDKEAAKQYKIRMMPTQVWLDKEGKEIGRHIGKMDEAELNKLLKERGVIE